MQAGPGARRCTRRSPGWRRPAGCGLAGAREVIALAAHGLFVGAAATALADPHIGTVVVTDSVPAFRLPAGGPVARKLRVVSAAPLFAQAIRDSHIAWLR